jgi:outer membrane protein assembly factor BamD
MALSFPIPTAAPRLATALGLCVAAFCVITACSSTPKTQDTAKKALSGTDEQIFLGDTIEKNYDPNVIMKRGEAFFEKEEYTEAIVEYNHFLDLHRTHTLASYASFRIGESHMKRAKGIDRDPDPIQKAIEAFERLRKDFQGSRYDTKRSRRSKNATTSWHRCISSWGNSIIGAVRIWPPHIASNKS